MKGRIMEEKKEQKKNNKDIKKISTQVIAAILFLVILIVTLITIACTVKASNLAFLRYKFYIMRSQSQTNIAYPGDLVIAKKMSVDKMKVGDSIVYGGKKYYFADSITQVKKANTITKVIVAEKDGVRYQFSEGDIEGKVVKTIPELGNIISFLRTPLGMVIFIIFTICVFALLRVLLLKGKDDDADNNKKQYKQQTNYNSIT